MECNNILLDYYKKRKYLGYYGSQLLSAGEGRCADRAEGRVSRRRDGAPWPLLSLGLAPPGTRGTERRGHRAGDAQLGVLSPLSVFSRHFTQASASPRKAAVSDRFCFTSVVLFWFVLYLGTLWCKTCHSHRGNHVTIEPLLKEIVLDTWGNSCKALSDFQCIYFIHVILEVFLLWGIGMAVSVFKSGQYKRKVLLISEMLPVLGRPQYSRNILFLCSAVPLTSHSLGFVFSFCVERQMSLVLHSKIFKSLRYQFHFILYSSEYECYIQFSLAFQSSFDMSWMIKLSGLWWM